MRSGVTHKVSVFVLTKFRIHQGFQRVQSGQLRFLGSLPSNVSELTAVGLTPVPSHTVAPPRIQQAPIAFECVLHEKLETPSRYVFIGRIQWLAARDGLIDTEAWRVNLRDYKPVARFGASFYTRTEDRFSLSDKAGEAPSVNTAIDQM